MCIEPSTVSGIVFMVLSRSKGNALIQQLDNILASHIIEIWSPSIFSLQGMRQQRYIHNQDVNCENSRDVPEYSKLQLVADVKSGLKPILKQM